MAEGNETKKTAATGDTAEHPSLLGLQHYKDDQDMENSSLHDMVRGRTNTPVEATSLLDVGMRCDTPFVSIPAGEDYRVNYGVRRLLCPWGRHWVHQFIWIPQQLIMTMGTMRVFWWILNCKSRFVMGKLVNQENLLYQVPKFCNHCKNVGQSIVECQVLRVVH
ncbi:hypothetical protein GIB67_025752, partial [Kingdonia uniflora]